jgi:DNA-binding transcriptional MerR regulator
MNTEAAGRAGSEPRWRIGQLAEATGVSVRSLRHYDRIGLLVPSGRNAVGHRRYTDPDVRRLHQLVALRGFGLSLAEVGRVLDGTGADPRELLRQQLDQVEQRIVVAQRLRHTLLGVLGALDDTVEPSLPQLVELIEGMTAMQRPLTPEQLEQMVEERRQAMAELSPDELAELARQRQRYADQLSAEELAEMRRGRAALLPPGWGQPTSA